MKRSSPNLSASGRSHLAPACLLTPSTDFKTTTLVTMAVGAAAVFDRASSPTTMVLFLFHPQRCTATVMPTPGRTVRAAMPAQPEAPTDMTPFPARVRRSVAAALKCGLFLLFALLGGSMGRAQSLTVLPVNIQLPSKQKATTLTVINQGDADTSIQIRAYAWSQHDGSDQLAESNVILISPPLATIAPGARQIVRLLLRHPAEGREDSYRILLDQIPPPAEPGVIHVVLRMSIPVFAMPSGRPLANLLFHIERAANQTYLVASNTGPLHESFHDLKLSTDTGLKLKTSVNALEYVLSGSTRRWSIAPEDAALLQRSTVRLTAIGNNGPIAQQVRLVDAP